MTSVDKLLSRKVLTLSAHYNPPKGGVAQVVSTYSNMFDGFRHVATKKGSKIYQKVFSLILAVPYFLFLCITSGVEIVHIHGSSNNSFYRKRIFIYLSRLLGKKIIYHVHGAEYKKFYNTNPSAIKAALKKVDVVVALSESWRCFFEDEVGHPNVRVIENVIPKPTKIPVKGSELTHYLFLGVFGERKGIYDLLEAVARNSNELRGKVIVHIGGNGEVERVDKVIKSLGVDDIVVNEGWVSGERKIQLLNLADVYLLPSYDEGLPISILEAMSYKLPIISTPVGGIPEIVKTYENGILVEPGDIDALGKAMLSLLYDSDYRIRAGEASFKKVQPYFPEKVSEKLNSLYRGIL